MPDEKTPDAPLPYSAAEDQPELLARRQEAERTARPFSGQSVTHGLREVADSRVPGHERSHVFGPQQAPCDPVAAGLDPRQRPLTSQEDRVITRTGVIGSGARSGAAQDGAPEAVSDGSQVAAPADAASGAATGPTAAAAGEA